jgi:hypothetical protein
MPRSKRELTWHKSTNRWRKRKSINGKPKDFYFRHPKNQQGYENALAEWKNKESELEQQQKEQQTNLEYDPYVNSRRLLAKAKAMDGDLEQSDQLSKEADQMVGLQEKLIAVSSDADKSSAVAMQMVDLLEQTRRPFNEDEEIDKIAVVKTEKWNQANKPPTEKQTGFYAKQRIDERLKEVRSGQLSDGQWAMVRTHINHFADWYGRDKAVDEIGDKLPEYKSYLLDLIEKEEIKTRTGSQRLKDSKNFVRWLYVRNSLSELPRILTVDSDLSISVDQPDTIVFPRSEVDLILSNCPDEQMRLYILLSLNCAFLQKDIGMLSHDMIDWKEGRIIKRREKTKKKAKKQQNDKKNKPKIPLVNYLLWRETFELLKKHRSSHPDLVLLNTLGNPLWVRGIDENEKQTNNCAITNRWNRLKRKLKIDKPYKTFRATSADHIHGSDYLIHHPLFLGDVDKSIGGIHYSTEGKPILDEAIRWLGEQYGIQ